MITTNTCHDYVPFGYLMRISREFETERNKKKLVQVSKTKSGLGRQPYYFSKKKSCFVNRATLSKFNQHFFTHLDVSFDISKRERKKKQFEAKRKTLFFLKNERR